MRLLDQLDSESADHNLKEGFDAEMKFTKLIILFLFFSSLPMGMLEGSAALLAQERSPLDIVGRGSSLVERVGNDDGALFAIHFVGDIHGNLDTCG